MKRLSLGFLMGCCIAACAPLAPQVSSLDSLKQGCHQDYNAQQCRSLAELYDEGRGVNKDPAEAVALWTYACQMDDKPSCERVQKVHSDLCNEGIPESCVGLGYILEEVEGSPAQALAAHQKACDAGYGPGCARIAVLVSGQDPKRADEMYQKACKLNDIFSCNVLGFALASTAAPDSEAEACAHLEKAVDQSLCHASLGIRQVAPDPKVVDDVYIATTFNTACEAEDIDGCLYLARMFELNRVSGAAPMGGDAAKAIGESCKGKGTMCYFSLEEPGPNAPELLPLKAVSLYERVCSLGDSEGCFSAGILYADGKGLPQDTKKAAGLLSQACDAGHLPACTRLGLLHLSPAGEAAPPNVAEAYGWLLKACPAGSDQGFDDIGCVHLSRMYENGIGTEKDIAKAKQASERVCEGSAHLGDEEILVYSSCFRDVALAYEGGLVGGPNTEKASQFHEKACRQGHLISCYDLGQIHRQGRGGIQANQAFAKAFLTMACDGGEPLGCRAMSELYLEGINGAPDPVQAAQMLTKACEHGLIDARCDAPITPESLTQPPGDTSEAPSEAF